MDYKRKIIIFKIFLNLMLPILPLVRNTKKNGLNFSLYASYVLFAITAPLIMGYVMYKTVQYNRLFLRKIYVPGSKLFIVLTVLEFLTGGIFYFLLKSIIFPILNSIFALIATALVILKEKRHKAKVCSFEMNFKLGIIGNAIGNEENGLKVGEVVKIIKQIENGYIVRNHKKQEFIVNASDLAEIIGMV